MTVDPLPLELFDSAPAVEVSGSARPPVSGRGPGGAYGEVFARFAAWLDSRRLAPATKRGYAERVDKYLRWLSQYEAQADPVTQGCGRDWAVRDYRRYLLTVAKATPATVTTTLTAVAALYEALGLPGIDVPRSTSTRHAPAALGEGQQRRLLRAAETRGARDRAVVALLHATGLRVAEAAALDMDDVPLTARTGAVQVRAGKGTHGGRPRSVPLAADARAALRAWLDQRAHWPGAGTPALWLTRRGGRVSARSLRTIVDQTAAAAGIDACPHTLRHTAATRWIRAGVDLVTVAELLGHASLDTTRVYTLPSADDLAAAVEAGQIPY